MTVDETIQLLIDAGFTSGWSLLGTKLTLWEHDIEPPAPLTRPEALDETPTTD
jgi:hypothetical protein